MLSCVSVFTPTFCLFLTTQNYKLNDLCRNLFKEYLKKVKIFISKSNRTCSYTKSSSQFYVMDRFYDKRSISVCLIFNILQCSLNILNLNHIFPIQQGPVLSPLRDSPLRSKEETRFSRSPENRESEIYFFFICYQSFRRTLIFTWIVPDSRYSEDFLSRQLTNVLHTNTPSNSAGEGKIPIPKKVSILYDYKRVLPLQKFP